MRSLTELYGGPGDGREVAYSGGDYYEPRPSCRGENNAHGFPTVIRRAALYTPAFHPYAKNPETGYPKVVLVYRGERTPR